MNPRKMDNKKNFNFYLPIELMELVKEICKIEGWSMSHMVKEALKSYLKGMEKE